MEHVEGDDKAAEVSRRDMLKRGALVAGAAVWVTPALQVIGVGRQHAQAASGPTPTTPPPSTPTGGAGGKGISFIAFRFRCNGTTYFAKLEGSTLSQCQGPNSGANCGVDQSGAVSACGLNLFTVVTTVSGGEITQAIVTLNCGGGAFLSAGGAKAGTICFAGTLSGGGTVATFTS